MSLQVRLSLPIICQRRSFADANMRFFTGQNRQMHFLSPIQRLEDFLQSFSLIDMYLGGYFDPD